jgi:hypothetical protein
MTFRFYITDLFDGCIRGTTAKKSQINLQDATTTL